MDNYCSNKTHNQNKLRLAIELCLLFIAIPLCLFFLIPLPILPILWGFAALCRYVLMRDLGFDKSNLWRSNAIVQYLKPMFIRFIIFTIFLTIVISITAPDLLFNLIKQKPALWLVIIILYPILSVYPQELIYRAYFFHRYHQLFPHRWIMVVISGLAFGFMHIIFHNWIAVFLTTIGGTLFAYTYNRSKSTLLVSIEHSLFGCLMFSLGLGQFFYIGSIETISQSLRI